MVDVHQFSLYHLLNHLDLSEGNVGIDKLIVRFLLFYNLIN